jgi:hypothetical protein
MRHGFPRLTIVFESESELAQVLGLLSSFTGSSHHGYHITVPDSE